MLFLPDMKHSGSRVAIWIDHLQARIVTISDNRIDAPRFGPGGQDLHVKHDGTLEGRPRRDAKHFFRRVERLLEHAAQILVLGPSTAKLDLIRYLRKHAHGVERRVVGIETMAQPLDAQLNTLAQEYFPVTQDDEPAASPS